MFGHIVRKPCTESCLASQVSASIRLTSSFSKKSFLAKLSTQDGFILGCLNSSLRPAGSRGYTLHQARQRHGRSNRVTTILMGTLGWVLNLCWKRLSRLSGLFMCSDVCWHIMFWCVMGVLATSNH